MIKLNKEKANKLLERLSRADKEKMLTIVLKRTLSYIGLFELCMILENMKKEDFSVKSRVLYLLEEDLSEWEKDQTIPAESITVTVKGFNKIEEAQEFCEWYSGQGEQDASIWFDCRKSEGVIDVSTMNADIIHKTDKNNIDMTLKLYN